MNEVYEQTCFQIISFAGTAKSCFLEAIECAKAKGDPSELLKEGNGAIQQASISHQKALTLDANGELEVGLLLIHAETILSSAETVRDLSQTIIDLLINK